MQNISQRSKNSNRCSVQWLLRGDHKTESWGLVGNLSRGVTPLTLVPKLFIREAAVFHALACESLTPSLTLFNDKNKQENKTTPPPPQKKNPFGCVMNQFDSMTCVLQVLLSDVIACCHGRLKRAIIVHEGMHTHTWMYWDEGLSGNSHMSNGNLQLRTTERVCFLLLSVPVIKLMADVLIKSC